MVGILAGRSREEATRELHSIKYSMDVLSKLEHMNQLKSILLHPNPSLLPEFIPHIIQLQSDSFSPVRKSLAQMIGEIGFVHVDFVPELLPVLIDLFGDETPAVARQAIASGTSLFCRTLEKVAVQGLQSSGLDVSLTSSWDWMRKFKDTLYPIAVQPGTDGIRVLAVKFVEAMILLYTPDPDRSSESQSHQACGFDISCLRGGHPLLNAGDLSMEASQSLGLLLDQLRSPKVKSLSNSVIVVLIKSLSEIAKKRPSFHGRILPVLLGLEPPVSTIKGLPVAGVHHTLRNAFLSLLNCTNPGAAPWRNRLVGALQELKAGESAVQAVQHFITSGGMEKEESSTYLIKEENPLTSTSALELDPRKKRSLAQVSSDSPQDNGVSVKKLRPTSPLSAKSDGVKGPKLDQEPPPLVGSTSSSGNSDAVKHLSSLFGTLVAQGEIAAGSLELIISSISADLIAELVMSNMQFLPPTRPEAEEDGEPAILTSHSTQPCSFISEVASLFGGFPQITSLLDVQDNPKENMKTERPDITMTDIGAHGDISDATETMVPIGDGLPDFKVSSGLEIGDSNIQLDTHDTEHSGIPGLSGMRTHGLPESLETTNLASTGLPGLTQDRLTNVESVVPVSSGSMLADGSDEVSPNVTVSDAISVASISTTSALSSQFVLPKMSAPVVNLTDEQKDDLQRTAFTRIIESYNRVSVAGGSQLRFSLLACLGVEYPLELDPWKLLQKHIFSDYLNHEGHELTMRVLFRLYREAEQENDFFSSTTATSVYESFLLIVAETLRDSFPASDKSLSRLLGEVPYIPKSAFSLLESMCSPGSTEKTDKELQNGDRVTQGLSAVWSLILLRPPIRDVCLKIALQSAVHQTEEIRMKAIRLVANKLYPISGITQQIEDFATEMLLSVKNSQDTEGVDDQEATAAAPKDSDIEKPPTSETAPNEISSGTHQSGSPPSISSSISEAQRRMSLYFALCTKKHSLFRQVFVIYNSIPQAVVQAVHRQIPILVRTIGTSSELLAILSDPPPGSQSLLMQVLNILTDGTIPSPDLVSTVKRLYDTRLKDVEILIPVLSLIPKEEVLSVFPQLVNLPSEKFQAALSRLLQGSSHFGPLLTPSEVLISIHGIDPDKDGIPLKKVTDACNACFEQRQIFTQQVLAKVLNQLVEQIPLPLLFMRTVLQTISAFPALVDFIMEILSRLVTKQIWKYPKLWVGFLKCALLTKPQSFGVLLQLPAAQLENALNRTAAPLKPSLVAHANQPHVRSTLPRSTLVVLGLALDPSSSQAQSTAGNQAPPTAGNQAPSTAGNPEPSTAGNQAPSTSGNQTAENSAEGTVEKSKDSESAEKSKESSTATASAS